MLKKALMILALSATSTYCLASDTNFLTLKISNNINENGGSHTVNLAFYALLNDSSNCVYKIKGDGTKSSPATLDCIDPSTLTQDEALPTEYYKTLSASDKTLYITIPRGIKSSRIYESIDGYTPLTVSANKVNSPSNPTIKTSKIIFDYSEISTSTTNSNAFYDISAVDNFSIPAAIISTTSAGVVTKSGFDTSLTREDIFNNVKDNITKYTQNNSELANLWNNLFVLDSSDNIIRLLSPQNDPTASSSFLYSTISAFDNISTLTGTESYFYNNDYGNYILKAFEHYDTSNPLYISDNQYCVYKATYDKATNILTFINATDEMNEHSGTSSSTYLENICKNNDNMPQTINVNLKTGLGSGSTMDMTCVDGTDACKISLSSGDGLSGVNNLALFGPGTQVGTTWNILTGSVAPFSNPGANSTNSYVRLTQNILAAIVSGEFPQDTSITAPLGKAPANINASSFMQHPDKFFDNNTSFISSAGLSTNWSWFDVYSKAILDNKPIFPNDFGIQIYTWPYSDSFNIQVNQNGVNVGLDGTLTTDEGGTYELNILPFSSKLEAVTGAKAYCSQGSTSAPTVTKLVWDIPDNQDPDAKYFIGNGSIPVADLIEMQNLTTDDRSTITMSLDTLRTLNPNQNWYVYSCVGDSCPKSTDTKISAKVKRSTLATKKLKCEL